MSLCNNAYVNNNEYIGSSIEIALLKYLHENNYEISKQERVEEKEFDSTRKMMSCVCKNEGKLDEYCKGAYDRIISLCKYIYIDNSKTLIDENIKKRLDNEINKEANMGKRLLAFAIKENVKEVEEYEMSFIGFISFFDKPREGVKEAIESFKNAGVKTVMITGDYINTAFSIGKDLGICDEENECISGENIDKLSDLELKEIIKDKTIFARVSPLHKSRIVGAFKDNGDVVAMTGDGVNDAPSLKKADIGISMGITGNDVSKEASDMILVDDNFVTIETAIEEGRTIYNNIKKAILFLLSSNLSEIIIMLIAIIFKLPLPLLAIQILIVNLLTDSIPALALGADLKEDDVMKQKPRSKNETLFSNGGARVVILYGTLIAIITFIAYLIPSLSYSKSVYGHVSLHGIKSSLAFDEIIMKAQTYSFITLSLCELFYSIVSRNVNKSVFRKDVLNNKFLNISVVSAIIISYFLVSVTKLESILGFYKVNITEYIFLVLLSASIIFLHELVYDLFHVKPKKKRKIE